MTPNYNKPLVSSKICYNEVYEPLGQFRPNLVGHMPGRWGIRYLQIKWVAPFGTQ